MRFYVFGTYLINMNSSTKKDFETLLENYFSATLEDHPTWANSLGIKSAEGKLEEPTLRLIRKGEKRRQKALSVLGEMSVHQLEPDQQLDRLAFRAMLVAESEDFKRGVHLMDPSAVDDLFGVLLHEMQRGEDEPARAKRNIRNILNQSQKFLLQSAKLIKYPELVWRRIMEQSVRCSSDFMDALRVFMGPKSEAMIGKLERSVARYHAAIMKKPLAPRNSFALGEAGLQRRIRDELGLDYTLAEVEAIALSEADRIEDLLGKETKKYDSNKSAGEIIEIARSEWKFSGELLEFYQSETQRVAKGFRSRKAVSFPKGDELDVRLVPEFMRHLYPTAAYSSPGPFEKRQRGVFWVNDLSLTKTTLADKLSEVQQHFGVSLTCAHEAYPGHHLQFVTANKHKRKWRALFAHAIFYEGWTLWCEQMMTDLKIDSSRWTKIIQLHDAFWRVHRILVDLRLHTGRYNYQQGVGHLQKYVGFTKARAEADVNWYTSSPAVPMSYWLGRLENDRLYRRLVKKRGWSLKKFNDWLLSHGTLPQSWLEKYMLD